MDTDKKATEQHSGNNLFFHRDSLLVRVVFGSPYNVRSYLLGLIRAWNSELATILLCVRSILEMGLWFDLVHYCVYRIEESMDETLFEEMDEDSAVVH